MYIKHALLKGPAHTGAPHFGRLSCVRELFRRQLTCFFTLFPSLHGLFPFLVLYFIFFRCPWGEIPVVANRIRPSKGKAKHDHHKQVFCFHSLPRTEASPQDVVGFRVQCHENGIARQSPFQMEEQSYVESDRDFVCWSC